MKKILIILLFVIILVGCRKEKDYGPEYKALEDSMLEAAKRFAEINAASMPKTEGEVYSIGLSNLYNGDFITNKLKDPKTNKDCDIENSFVHTKLQDGQIVYTVHLVCGDYSTK
ncbi:MAG: hypothetical protein ACOXZS_03340 [Bacilli bacterium]|jgi:hypothetical protein